jgi:hypothetical protein
LNTDKKVDSSAMTTRVGQAPKKVFKGLGKPNGKTHCGTKRQDIKKGFYMVITTILDQQGRLLIMK